MNTNSTAVPVRYLNLTEILSGMVDSVAGFFTLLRGAFMLAERAEAGHRITLEDLKQAGMF